MKLFTKLALLLCFSISATVRAQAPSAIQQSEQIQKSREIQAPKLKLQADDYAPELYPGENEDVGPQRVLKLKPRRTPFEVVADSQYLWSDNVALNGSGFESESTIFVNTLQAAITPSPCSLFGRDFFGRIGARAQWYNYGLDTTSNGLGIFDFRSESLFAEGRYQICENWQASLGIDAGQLTTQGTENVFYREVAPNWGLQWLWKLADNKVLLVNYRGYYHFSTTVAPFASSSINNRTDHNLSIAYNQEILPRLVVQPFYRVQFTHYTSGSTRNDLLHEAGVNLTYYFTRWASARTFATYEAKHSGDKTVVPSYDKLNLGLGAALDFQF